MIRDGESGLTSNSIRYWQGISLYLYMKFRYLFHTKSFYLALLRVHFCLFAAERIFSLLLELVDAKCFRIFSYPLLQLLGRLQCIGEHHNKHNYILQNQFWIKKNNYPKTNIPKY